MTSIYVKFDFLSMIVAAEYVLTGTPPSSHLFCHRLYLLMNKLCTLLV